MVELEEEVHGEGLAYPTESQDTEINVIINTLSEEVKEEARVPCITIMESPSSASLKLSSIGIDSFPFSKSKEDQEAKSNPTESAAIYGPSRDIDGGWAWVVLFAAFCSFATASGEFVFDFIMLHKKPA